MNLWRLGANKKAVVLLGAGASRGASFVNNKKILPPLDKDFFEQLQRLPSNGKELPHIQLLGLARDEFGQLLDISMESFFSQIQFLDSFHRALKIDRGSRIKRYDKILNAFTSVLVEVFHECFYDTATQQMHNCGHHGVLAKVLEKDDTIMSFNYDCLMDLALKKHAGKKWNTKCGYGFDIEHGCRGWHTHKGQGKTAKEHSIRLLKMHGSLNWDRTSQSIIKLRSDPYDVATVRRNREVIPPVWNKDILSDDIYQKVWREARNRLRGCKVLLAVGYSVPETDLMSRSLIRVETPKLDYLIIANPNPADRNRFKKLVVKSIKKDTKVLEFDDLEKLAAFLRPLKVKEKTVSTQP